PQYRNRKPQTKQALSPIHNPTFAAAGRAVNKTSSDSLRTSGALLVWKCREDGKTISDFATDHIDVSVTYPHVGVQTVSIVLGRAVVKHRGNASPPEHQLRGKTSLKTRRTPWHPLRSGRNRPPNSLHRIRACMARKRSTNRT